MDETRRDPNCNFIIKRENIGGGGGVESRRVDTRYVNELTTKIQTRVAVVHPLRLFVERALFSIRAAINALSLVVLRYLHTHVRAHTRTYTHI